MNTSSPRRLGLAPGLALACLLSAAAPPDAGKSDKAPELEGTWTWSWKDRGGQTHRHVLEVEGKGAKLAAREIFDDEPAVRVEALTLAGRDLKFTVVRGERRSDYTGKIEDADHVNGAVLVTAGGQASEFPWKAERRKAAPR